MLFTNLVAAPRAGVLTIYKRELSVTSLQTNPREERTYLGCHIAYQTEQDGGLASCTRVPGAKTKLKYSRGEDEHEGVGVDGEDD